MRTPSEARATILSRIALGREVEEVALSDALGRFLARPAVSDVDLPPFEKSMMDGYAVHSADLARPEVSLTCIGESRAGEPFAGSVPRGSCIEIYTGAELPAECDAVEQVENTEREGEEVRFHRAVAPERHVSHLGEILGQGREVFGAGRRLTPADQAVLAAIGWDPVPVFRRPRVSVLTTGDELVPARTRPGRGQIREGNTFFLASACAELGCEVLGAGIVPDRADELEQAFGRALEEGDVLITTGGVSVGKYDLVGRTFEALGVEPVLHKVAIKPGKPIWFGVRGEQPVFGLPGNPVSSLLGFEVFVRPSLLRLAGAGEADQAERLAFGHWRGPSRTASGRQHNLPARRIARKDGGVDLEPVPWRGSADIVAVAESDALVVIPPDETIEAGQLVTFRPLR